MLIYFLHKMQAEVMKKKIKIGFKMCEGEKEEEDERSFTSDLL